MTWTDAPIAITTFTQQTVGTGVSHENRPKFYTLGYIIYVGRKRS
jgi:hypothetical protein